MRGLVFVILVLGMYAASNGTLIKIFDAGYKAAQSPAPKAAK